MNKRTCIFLYLLINSQCSFALEEQKEHTRSQSAPPEIHLTIDVQDHENTEQITPHTQADIKKLKIKTAAVTAIITALIGAGVSIYLGVHNCK